MARLTSRTPSVVSTPVILLNSRNFVDAVSSWSPVKPKRVLTSPTAAPISSKLAGTVFPTLRYTSSSCCAVSPVAPVFEMTTSIPSSTWLNAATAAVPTAASGAVTYFVKPDPSAPVALETLLAFVATSPNDLCSVSDFVAVSSIAELAAALSTKIEPYSLKSSNAIRPSPFV